MTARWYCVSSDGLATLCKGQEDAKNIAMNCNVLYPKDSPHRAMRLVDASRIEALEQAYMKAHSALELIATPKRPDGTWNRDREACRDVAAKTLAQLRQDFNTGDQR